MSHVYISYSREDRPFVDRLVQTLQAAQIPVWIDNQLSAGESWDGKIEEAIREAFAVIVVWSKRSVESRWVQAEVSSAQAADKPLLPILIDDAQPPFGFRRYQSVNLQGWNGDPADASWQRVLFAVRHYTVPQRTPQQAGAPELGQRAPTPANRAYRRPSGAANTLVFVAHASADKPRLRPFLEILLGTGFKVWIDKPQAVGLSQAFERKLANARIHFQGDWKEQIRMAVKKSRIVLGFWSEDAIEGRREQFQYELYMGLLQGKLRQCRIDPLPYDKIGFPYNFDHIADLSDFAKDAYHAELDMLMADFPRARRRFL